MKTTRTGRRTVNQYKLYLFADDSVVISDDPDNVAAEFGEAEITLNIGGDAHRFPCDRDLKHVT